jgi:hypothetical protein
MKRQKSRMRSNTAYDDFFSMPMILGAQKGESFPISSFHGKKPNWKRYFTTTTAC